MQCDKAATRAAPEASIVMLCVNAVAVPRAGALFIALGFVGYSIAMPGFTIGGQNTEKRPDIDTTGIHLLIRRSTRIPDKPTVSFIACLFIMASRPLAVASSHWRIPNP